MAPAPGPFAPRSDLDVVSLVREQPLAWLVSAGEGAFMSTLLPVMPVLDERHRITHLRGHLSRRNDQVAHLKRYPRARILVLGPHGYVSPSWMHDRTQAPTWNYASAAFDVNLGFSEDVAGLEAHLRHMVGTMEADRPQSWQVDEMGPRMQRLARGIIAFEAEVLAVEARFKLGQDERDDVFADILSGLERSGDDTLATWMRRFADRN